jgi:predicted lipoprotein
LDNLRVHHSKPVKEWLAVNKQAIEVFCLPSYSPELNPDEMAQCRSQASCDQAGASADEAAARQSHREASAQRPTAA